MNERTTNSILNIIIYVAGGTAIGWILGQIFFGIGWLKWLGFIAGIGFAYSSMKELDGQFHWVFAPFNNFKEVAEPGFGVYLFGWSDSYFIKYTKALFTCEKPLRVEYKKSEEEFENNIKHSDSEGEHIETHVNKKKLYDYPMIVKRSIALKINPRKIELFYTKSGEKELIHTKIDEKTMPWLKTALADLDSTIELIALARGFLWMKAHADWDIDSLIREAKEAVKHLKEKKIVDGIEEMMKRVEQGGSLDTLRKTFEDIGLQIERLSIDVNFPEELDEAIQAQIIAEEKHTAALIEAATKAEASKIQTNQDAKNLKKMEDAKRDLDEKRGLMEAKVLRKKGQAKADAELALQQATAKGMDEINKAIEEKLSGTSLSPEMKVKYAGIFMGKVTEAFNNNDNKFDIKGLEDFTKSLKAGVTELIEKKITELIEKKGE